MYGHDALKGKILATAAFVTDGLQQSSMTTSENHVYLTFSRTLLSPLFTSRAGGTLKSDCLERIKNTRMKLYRPELEHKQLGGWQRSRDGC